jgi:hypothetical protein
MEDNDFMDELNRLADNAESLERSTTSFNKIEIGRWQSLFSYTEPEAELLMKMQAADVTQDRIPDAHWELIHEDVEAAGHSRLSWEHLLQMKDAMKANSTTLIDNKGKRWALLRMVGFMRDVESIKEITGMKEDPKVAEVAAMLGNHEVSLNVFGLKIPGVKISKNSRDILPLTSYRRPTNVLALRKPQRTMLTSNLWE